MSQTAKSGGGKVRRSLKRDSINLFKDGFNWDKYLQLCNLPAAPLHCFTQNQTEKIVNNFKLQYKLEAQDPRNPTSICLATVVALQAPRILIRLDGGDDRNDFWKLIDSEDIFPLGTHEEKGVLLQPPLGYTRNMSTWSTFLAKTREKGVKAGKECFLPKPNPPESNLFEIGMKLEAVDRKNSHLICPATIGDTKLDQVFVAFDGWRGAMDYWCDYSSRDLFPVGWCEEYDHPLSNPGNKGDNPVVVDKLKIIAENARRKTRSGAQNVSEADKNVQKSLETPAIPLKYEPAQSKTSRNRQRMRLARSNQSAKQRKIVAKNSKNFTQPRPSQSLIASSVTESSHESETGDSSVSSEDSSDSSEENHDETAEKPDSEDSEIDESVVEIKRPNSHSTDLRHRDRRLSNSRKRYASLGEDELLSAESKAKKKLMLQSDSPLATSHNSSVPNPPVDKSSCFTDKDQPPSLFGLTRDDIVKKATDGWPTRLMTPKSVVTSDNKLARFGTTNFPDSSVQGVEDVGDALALTTNAEVTECKDRGTPDSTFENISSHTVSSTTNPAPVDDKPIVSGLSEARPFSGVTLPSENTLPRGRLRNPEKWTVGDVIDYVRDHDSALAPMVRLFQIHEIDGPALMLINSSIAVKYMSMKLGPALKLANLVERVKSLVPRGTR